MKPAARSAPLRTTPWRSAPCKSHEEGRQQVRRAATVRRPEHLARLAELSQAVLLLRPRVQMITLRCRFRPGKRDREVNLGLAFGDDGAAFSTQQQAKLDSHLISRHRPQPFGDRADGRLNLVERL